MSTKLHTFPRKALVLTAAVRKSNDDSTRAALKRLYDWLGISDLALNYEDDLMTVKDARIAGTCAWFTTKSSYVKWRDSANAARTLWVHGMPASGKTVLAGYVIDQIHDDNRDHSCSYFFFKHGDKSRSRLSSCLRSLAMQMAYADGHIREVLLEIMDDIALDDHNDLTLWRKLFTSGIFQTQNSQHYWIIDALDECSDAVKFGSMLAKIDPSVPLRILITSRDTAELDKLFANAGRELVVFERIEPSDTLADIKRVAEARSESLVVRDGEHRNVLIEKLVSKSQGSFLWTVLTLNELYNSYSEETMLRALEELPQGMRPFYQRTLDQMSLVSHSRNLVQAILVWTTCATRPLTTSELEGALGFDIHDRFANMERTIAHLCGQLVIVDRFGKVQMVHATAREFLLDEGLESDFAVRATQAHTRIARACLMCLTEDEMKPPRTARRGSVGNPADRRSAFSRYACDSFSYHLSKADPGDTKLLVLVDKFLKANVLSWIEAVAWSRSITPLIRSATYLKKYLHAVSLERSPAGQEIQIIRGWATDLIRIAARFSNLLITLPSAIYSLVPPFCPTGSTISQTALRGRKFSLLGLSDTQWDDRLSCIHFRQGYPSVLCHGDAFFAVGLPHGRLVLYHQTTCQEYRTLDHGEAVRQMQFGAGTAVLASCGMKLIKVWDVHSGIVLHVLEAPPRPISLAFDKDVLMVASQKNYLASWDLACDGARRPDRPWKDSGDDVTTPFRGQPCAISISVSHGMLAVAYSNRPIILWDLEDDSYYGSCGKKMPNGKTSTYLVTALVFNPNKNIELLVASYLDGELALLDPFSDLEIQKTRANCLALAASPNGQLLGSAVGGGVIEIFEFDTLRLIYRVKSTDYGIRQISFSRDSLHFADIRGSQCNIWEPAALLREAVDDDESEGTTDTLVEAVSADPAVSISVLIVHSEGDVIFCGKDDGSVCTYDLNAGKLLRTLYRHKMRVKILEWWPQASTLTSVDISNRIYIWVLTTSGKEGWVTDHMVAQSRLDRASAVVQLVANPACDKLLLSTRESDHLWSSDAQQLEVRELSGSQRARIWLQHPLSQSLLVCMDGLTAQVYKWSDWSQVASLSFAIDMTCLQLKRTIYLVSKKSNRLLLELSEQNRSAETRSLYLLDADSFSLDKSKPSSTASAALENKLDSLSVSANVSSSEPTANPLFTPQLQSLGRHVAHVIGLSDAGRLVFLDKGSWVCSINMDDIATGSYSRHFFIPHDWFAGTRHIKCGVGRHVVLAKNQDAVVAKGGMDLVETISLDVAAS